MKDKMTVKEFLESGYRFEVGDVVSNSTLSFHYTALDSDINKANIQDTLGSKLAFVTKSAALEREKAKEQEWKNGDECTYKGCAFQFVSILSDRLFGTAVIFNEITEELKQVPIKEILKPLTPQQKEEQARLEAVGDITDFLESLSPDCKKKMEYVARAIVEKTGYRVEK